MYSEKILYSIIVENSRNQKFSRYIILDKNIPLTSIESIAIKYFNNVIKVIEVRSIDDVSVII